MKGAREATAVGRCGVHVDIRHPRRTSRYLHRASGSASGAQRRRREPRDPMPDSTLSRGFWSLTRLGISPNDFTDELPLTIPPRPSLVPNRPSRLARSSPPVAPPSSRARASSPPTSSPPATASSSSPTRLRPPPRAASSSPRPPRTADPGPPSPARSSAPVPSARLSRPATRFSSTASRGPTLSLPTEKRANS